MPEIDPVMIKLDGLEKLINTRFEVNLKDHRQINKHLDVLNGRVSKHSTWINENHRKVEEDVPANTGVRNKLRLYLVSSAILGGSLGGSVGVEVKALILSLIGF